MDNGTVRWNLYYLLALDQQENPMPEHLLLRVYMALFPVKP